MSLLPLVVLAGGASSRMGRAKGLVPYRGLAWLEAQLGRFRQASGRRAVVVLGADAAAYRAALPWIATAHDASVVVGGIEVRVVVNPEPALGPFGSLAVGLRCILHTRPPKPPGVFVLPVDTPCAPFEALAALAGALADGAAAATPRFGGRGGHPAALGVAFARAQLEAFEAARARSMDAAAQLRLDHALAREPSSRRVPVRFPLVGRNANTPEDFEALARELDAAAETDAGRALASRDDTGTEKPTSRTDPR